MPAQWKFKPVDESLAGKLSAEIGLSPLLSRILVLRGLSAPDEARRFLAPETAALHEPAQFSEMEAAAGRILRAAREGERVVVHGDYDVDGVSATCIMLETLRDIGLEPDHYLPNRLTEAYGLRMETAEALAGRYDLMITVDCGTASVEEIARANELGMDTIVTDHHDPGPERPPARAVLNPHSPGETYPNKHLSGSAVAWQLSRAVLAAANAWRGEDHLLEIAALGLVADMMPLLGENRALVARALKRFKSADRPGLLALMDVAKAPPAALTARDIGFRLGPRINAASRIDSPEHALELLMARDEARAWELARYLNQLNGKRQSLERQIFDEARAAAAGPGRDGSKLLFLAGRGWHRGVLGIVAQKLMIHFGRPVFLAAIEEDGVAHGSARSMEGAPLIPLLDRARPHAISCGGHACAGGMRVREENLERFERALREAAEEHWGQTESPPVWIDAEATLEQIDADHMADMDRLEPFGQANPEPVFFARAALDGAGPRIVGNNHLRLSLRHPRGTINAIGFGLGGKLESLCGGGAVELAFHCRFNEYQGRRDIQLHLLDVRSAQAGAPRLTVRPAIDRKKLGEIYRLLMKSRNDEGALKRSDSLLLARIAKMSPEEFGAALTIFREIDLLDLRGDTIIMKDNAEKKNLEDSPTYQSMAPRPANEVRA